MLEIELQTCEDQLQSLMLQSFNVYVNEWKGVTDKARRKEEKKQLLKKENQLLKKDNQLREEKKQLRQEKLALLGSSKRSIPVSPGT